MYNDKLSSTLKITIFIWFVLVGAGLVVTHYYFPVTVL